MAKQKVDSDVGKLDLYGILEVAFDATEKEIVKAYRQRARKCHPDKNPDNPKAAELFHEVSQALEILTDAAARAAYDKLFKAKKAAEARHRELDAKRKRFKEDLEARENAAQEPKKPTEADIATKLKNEIERLRKEGSRLLQQEQELLKKQLNKEDESINLDDGDQEQQTPKLKVKWKSKKTDENNGGYSYEFLHKAFSKYGEVTTVLVSGKKKGSAIIELSSTHSAILAVQNEIGIPSNPLSLSWLSGEPTSATHGASVRKCESQNDSTTHAAWSQPSQPMTSAERDYESVILMKMRQAEERKRLVEQLQKEDEDP